MMAATGRTIEAFRAPGVQSPGADAERVLVVDDNPSVLRFLSLAFTAKGCATWPASTAEQALELLRDQRFDLVVSDIKMPGLSGLDVLRAVKASQPATPVVLITGAPSVNSAIFGLRHGAYDYLAKPFTTKDIHDLLERVRRDRQESRIGLPAGLADELARRQFGVEALLRLGQLALNGVAPTMFVETVLEYALQSLRGAGALIALRENDGTFSASRRGDPGAVGRLSALLHSGFDRLVGTGGKDVLTLTDDAGGLSAMAAVIPGLGESMGVFGVARSLEDGAFVPEEKQLLLGYAQTTAIALQKILLRENVEKTLVDTISAFVNAIESKDLYLKGHSARVSLYAGETATVMGMPETEALMMSRAGMLHDLGKIVMLDSILRKPGRLSGEEYALIKTHPVVGDRILTPLRFLAREALAVRHHHERYDGNGYPDGLKGEGIPLIARVVSVSDVFDAMTSTRSYRRSRSLTTARDEIVAVAGTQLDPVVVQAFYAIPICRLEEISHTYAQQTDGAGAVAPSDDALPCRQAAAVMNG
jgi:response regulator RpfG family c-di-GMP phosphodiesterase